MAANMMYTAVAGLNTFNTALSVVSDNIANANTTGLKSNTVDFGDLVSGLIATQTATPRRRALDLGARRYGRFQYRSASTDRKLVGFDDPGHRVLRRREPHQQSSLLHQGWVVRGQFIRPISPIWKVTMYSTPLEIPLQLPQAPPILPSTSSGIFPGSFRAPPQLPTSIRSG